MDQSAAALNPGAGEGGNAAHPVAMQSLRKKSTEQTLLYKCDKITSQRKAASQSRAKETPT